MNSIPKPEAFTIKTEDSDWICLFLSQIAEQLYYQNLLQHDANRLIANELIINNDISTSQNQKSVDIAMASTTIFQIANGTINPR